MPVWFWPEEMWHILTMDELEQLDIASNNESFQLMKSTRVVGEELSIMYRIPILVYNIAQKAITPVKLDSLLDTRRTSAFFSRAFDGCKVTPVGIVSSACHFNLCESSKPVTIESVQKQEEFAHFNSENWVDCGISSAGMVYAYFQMCIPLKSDEALSKAVYDGLSYAELIEFRNESLMHRNTADHNGITLLMPSISGTTYTKDDFALGIVDAAISSCHTEGPGNAIFGAYLAPEVKEMTILASKEKADGQHRTWVVQEVMRMSLDSTDDDLKTRLNSTLESRLQQGFIREGQCNPLDFSASMHTPKKTH